MRCAIVEADTREEVMREMEDRMSDMEEMYRKRLMKSVSLVCMHDRVIGLILHYARLSKTR